MKILNLVQGTPEWIAHRFTHHNASEAAAMLGLDPKLKRNELLHMKATGAEKEFSDWVRKNILEKGHEVEAKARPLIEFMIGEELYPVTGVEGDESASYDGLTMDERIGFEHKQWNEELAAMVNAGIVPDSHMPQLQQQLMISGAEKIIFVVSNGTLEKMVHTEVLPDQEWFERIRLGWEQFDKDVAAYVPEPIAAPIVAQVVKNLPAVAVQVSGSIAIVDNFDVFETALRDFVDNRLIRKPETDQDFADLDLQIKALKKAEDAIKGAEANMLSQLASVDAMKNTMDMVYNLTRDNRLAAEKLLAAEKENRRLEILQSGKDAFSAHIAALNERLKKPYMPQIVADFAGVMKGLKTIASLRNAVDTELARVKIEANVIADKIEANLNSLRDLAKDHAFLFADTAQLVMKENDDLVALIKVRISEHQQAEEKRLAEERERIRAEEANKLREQREQEEAAELLRQAEEQNAKSEDAPHKLVTGDGGAAPLNPANDDHATPVIADTGATMKLGQIAERLGFSITAEFISALGIEPKTRERNAVLYRESDFPRICDQLRDHIGIVQADFISQLKKAA